MIRHIQMGGGKSSNDCLNDGSFSVQSDSSSERVNSRNSCSSYNQSTDEDSRSYLESSSLDEYEYESSSGYETTSDFSDGSSHASNDNDSILEEDGSHTSNINVTNETITSLDPQQLPSSKIMTTMTTAHHSTNRNFCNGVRPILSQNDSCRIDWKHDPNTDVSIRRRRKYPEKTEPHDQAEMIDYSSNHQSPIRLTRTARAINKSETTVLPRHLCKSQSKQSKSKPRRRSKTLKGTTSSDSVYCADYLNCQSKQRSTQILFFSFGLWIMAQIYCLYYSDLRYYLNNFIMTGKASDEYHTRSKLSGRQRKMAAHQRKAIDRIDYSSFGKSNEEFLEKYSPLEMQEIRQQRYKEALAALGTAAGSGDYNYRLDPGGKPNTRRNKRSRRHNESRDSEGSSSSERLKSGCVALKWHSNHFPNCNDLHDIDLREMVRYQVSDGRLDKELYQHRDESIFRNKTISQSFPWGYVGDGLWRDVFSCDPRGEVNHNNDGNLDMPPAVLKMMKSEHPYDQRNFQRHRRDALVMEVLSSSNYIVPIYGHCANSVLTQAISHTLDDVIYAREKEKVKFWGPQGGYQVKPPLESWMGKDKTGELLITRETEIGRIRLALGVFRGLMDLHEGVDFKSKNDVDTIEWLPIVHADLQAKQYLVDARTGQIYLNDFNRCRFLSKKIKPSNSTHDSIVLDATSDNNKSCPLYIPTAPGAARSPEEYDMAPLSEKIDVYSAGNILFGIITGNRPWDDERGKHIKSSIQRGERPQVNQTIRSVEGSVDSELARLLDWVYEGDPMKRASAKEIVHELENLLKKQMQKLTTN